MARKHFFYVYHPAGKEFFAEDEIKQANRFAQSLANETGKPISRRDVNGGESIFYPQFGAQQGGK